MEEQDQRLPSVFVIPLMQFIVGLLLFVALLNGERDLTILALLLFGLVFTAKLWARISLSGLQCHSILDKGKVFPGETLHFQIWAENRKFLPVCLRAKVPVPPPIDPSPGQGKLVKEESLLWYQRTRLDWELTARRRGVHCLGPLQISAGDLFAFFSREKEAEESHTVLVYPRIVALKPFPLPRRDFFGIPGGMSPVKDPIYILGTRNYQNGQPAKSIHWKASARHNRLQQKIFEPAQQEKILIIVDVSQFAKEKAEEEFERTLEIAASLAVRMDRRGCAVGLVTNGAITGAGPALLPAARNRRQISAILEVLARLRMEPRANLLDLLRRGFAFRWGLSCIHFAHREDEALAETEQFFKYTQTPILFLVSHPDLHGGTLPGRNVRCLDEICLKEEERA